MNSKTKKIPARWKMPQTILFLLGWTAFSLVTSLFYVYLVHSTGEAAPIGHLVIAVVACMATPKTNWRLWARILYPFAAYIGVSVIGILVMMFIYTPLAIIGIKESLGAIGNTLAGIPFLVLAMRQSRWFRHTESTEPTNRNEIPNVLPVSHPRSELSEWERHQKNLEQILYQAGSQGAFHIENFIRPLVDDGSCRLPESNLRAGCLVHSFALVWTGISLKVPVDIGKPYMDAIIDSLAKNIDLEFGFEWSREEIEASVGRTWHELVHVSGSSEGQELLQMSKHILRFYLEEDKIGLDQALQMVEVMQKIMNRGQIYLEAITQPV